MQPSHPHMSIFILYEYADHHWYRKLESHLSSLRCPGITISNNQGILPGANWKEQIEYHLNAADVILPLVSPDFLASEYHWNEEIQSALERRETGTVRVVPIILKRVDLLHTSLENLQVLPTGARPVTRWDDQDDAFHDVAQGIRRVVETLQITKKNDREGKKVLLEGDTLRKGRSKVVNIDTRTENTYLIGVDIDRSHLAILLTDQHATPIAKPWSGPFDTNFSAEKCLTLVAHELHEVVKRSGITWEQVIGIGLATPGPLDPTSRRVRSSTETMRSASQMPRWDGIDIPNCLEFQLKLQRKIDIVLGNDANMGALGESLYGAGRGCKDLIYIKIGKGIGAGLMLGGRLYSGSKNAAGEIGHWIAVHKGKAIKCACGRNGCLETVAAETTIVNDAYAGRSLHARNPQSHQIPILANRTGIIGIRDVIQAAQDGDEASRAAIESAAEWIATIAVGGLINCLNPALILLDGDIVRGYHDLRQIIDRQARASSLETSWNAVRIERCDLDFPVAYGAAANVLRRRRRM